MKCYKHIFFILKILNIIGKAVNKIMLHKKKKNKNKPPQVKDQSVNCFPNNRISRSDSFLDKGTF